MFSSFPGLSGSRCVPVPRSTVLESRLVVVLEKEDVHCRYEHQRSVNAPEKAFSQANQEAGHGKPLKTGQKNFK